MTMTSVSTVRTRTTLQLPASQYHAGVNREHLPPLVVVAARNAWKDFVGDDDDGDDDDDDDDGKQEEGNNGLSAAETQFSNVEPW